MTHKNEKLRYAISANLTRIDERRSKLKGYNIYALARYLDRGDEAATYIESGVEPEQAARRAGLNDKELIAAIVQAAKGKTIKRRSNRYSDAFTKKNPVRTGAKRKPPKRTRMKKPSAKQLAARAKFVARFSNAKRAKVARAVDKRRNPVEKYVIRGTKKTKTGYLHYYLGGNRFLSDFMNADRFGLHDGERKMRAILHQLPHEIDNITLIKAK